jgi:predicted transcriptional regulator
MAGLLDTLRRAIRDSGKSRYRIAQESGLTQAALSRFVNRKNGLGVESAEALARVLGLRIVVSKARKSKAPKGKGR